MKITRSTILVAVVALVLLAGCKSKHSANASSSVPSTPASVASTAESTPTTLTSSAPAGNAAGCTQPCATGGGLTIEIARVDGSVHSTNSDGHPEYLAGGLQLDLHIANGSGQDASLLPGYFSVVGGTGRKVVASVGAFVRSATDPTGHDCHWNAPILATGGSLGPVPICFTVPPAGQSGTLTLVYDDTVNPAVNVAFTLGGAATTSTSPAQQPTTAPAQAGGGAPSGRYSGTDNGLQVTFTSDGSRITGFSAVGGWTCGNGYAAMSFQLPDSPAVSANGSFGEKSSGTVNGAQLTWQVSGNLTGTAASGTLQVQSSQACALYSTPWTAHG